MEDLRSHIKECKWDRDGFASRYSLEIRHEGLNEYRCLTSDDDDVLLNKAYSQIKKWEEKWNTVKKKIDTEKNKIASKTEAEIKTRDAIHNLKEIDDLLIYTLSKNDVVDWEQLKKRDKYEEKVPEKVPLKELPPEPQREWKIFQINYSFFNRLIDFIGKLISGLTNKSYISIKDKKIEEMDKMYHEEHEKWDKITDEIDNDNQKINEKNHVLIEEWKQKKESFYAQQEEYNTKINNLEKAYHNCDQNAIVECCELVLNNSQYPESFSKSFEIEYNPETRILIIEYSLPTLEQFPTLKEVKYIATKNELKEYNITESQLSKMFDDSMYKIALRTIHEIFESDIIDVIDAITFNGWNNSINKATGIRQNTCIMSIHVNKQEFMQVDLAQVDPKACFKNFKGIGSSKLSGISPIRPIMQISREDKRFISSYDVTNTFDNSTNLAAIDWQDFEQLIREIFEKEFSIDGGEVKITQASRDRGVDAIVFYPDPIRGGKIVLQAKRYTNTVEVSAVRDLYGTVINEGATKGILITTADYGPDSYEFAKDKPLTLFNGANLLYLLEKHGHKAKIDLKEAKMIIAEREKEK